MSRTLVLALLAFAIGAGTSIAVLFPLRFLWVAYQHGGIW